MTGVSVRTLHHYDQIGLLKPISRSAAGYRLYSRSDLLRLQQILFFKELDLPLKEIMDILQNPSFNMAEALEKHKENLQRKRQQLSTLIKTVEKTLLNLKGDHAMLKDEELYEGFSSEQIKEIKQEVKEKYDPARVAESERRVKKMSKEQLSWIKEEQNDIPARMALLMDRNVRDSEVQTLVERHHKLIESFYDAPYDVYLGLSNLYVQDDRFRAFYDKHKAGLAQYFQEAIAYYCNKNLKND